MSGEPMAHKIQYGKVYLIGGGPGDPKLITLKAVEILGSSEVIIYDALVNPQLLQYAPPGAEVVFIGRSRHHSRLSQGEVEELMIQRARQGLQVARLKGGDPFIFGRGGEEIETLADEGIPFQVVPGITAAAGCAAYGGIPLTHRDHAQSCVFVTGHLKGDTVALDWERLIEPQQTIVIYMGLVGLPVICEELVAHGMPAETPAALIEHGTTASQRVITATIGTLAARVAAADVRAPTLIIIGGVVSLRDKLGWFEAAERHDANLDPHMRLAPTGKNESA